MISSLLYGLTALAAATAPSRPRVGLSPGTAAGPSIFPLSLRFKDAVKVALAMVLAYGISLALDWDKTYWAGLAVAMCGLTAGGDSLNKGLLRIAGTLAATMFTFVYLGLFPQDRWLFLLCLTLHGAFCTYMLGSTSRWYFWCALGFTPLILASGSGGNPLVAFDTVVLRAQQTLLGVLCFSLVSAFLWPQGSREPFLSSVRQLLAAQRQLTAHSLHRLLGGSGKEDDREGDIDALSASSAGLVGTLKPRLDAAELDGLDIWERRRSWRRFVARLPTLSNCLARWQQSLQDLDAISMGRIVPGLVAAAAEFDRRFAGIEQVLDGSPPSVTPSPVDLSVDPDGLKALGHFDRASVLSLQEILQTTDSLTTALLEDARAIRRLDSGKTSPAPVQPVPGPWAPDPDRLTYALRNFCAVWLGLLAWIYLPDLPKGMTLAILANSVTINMAVMPTMSGRVVIRPWFLSVLFAGTLYMLIMPRLSGFLELGTMLFLSTLLLAYLLPLPKHFISRPIALAMLVMITAVSNEQSYHFIPVAQWLVLFPIIAGILFFSGYFPVSLRAEDIFLRQVRRFFRSCAFVTAAAYGRGSKGHGPLECRVSAFHHRELQQLPAKIATMGASLPDERLGAGGGRALNALIGALPVLAYRLEDLSLARAALTSAPPPGLLAELTAWTETLTRLFQDLVPIRPAWTTCTCGKRWPWGKPESRRRLTPRSA